MRGLKILVTLALSLTLIGTAQAGHLSSTDATPSSQDTLEALSTFDQLILPNTLDTSTDQAEAALPGPNDALTLDTDLIHQRSLLFTTDTSPLSTLDLAPEQDADASDAETVDATDASPSTHEAPTQTNDDEDHEQAQMETASTATGDEDAEASTSSREDPSTASSLKSAWEDRSSAEKAAIGAGLLSMLIFGPLTLYSRIQRDDALENDTRRTIYEIVEADPGICIKDVAEDADVSYSTASYHLDRLVRMDYLARRKEGNQVLYYKNGGTFTQDEQELVPILKNTEAMRVFQHILENPWCYRAEVAEALDVSHTTVNWHLDNLQEADLVEEHREGRSCHLRIPEDALDRVTGVLDKLEEIGVEEDYSHVAAPVPA